MRGVRDEALLPESYLLKTGFGASGHWPFLQGDGTAVLVLTVPGQTCPAKRSRGRQTRCGRAGTRSTEPCRQRTYSVFPLGKGPKL